MSKNMQAICDKFTDEMMELNDLSGLAVGVSLRGEEYLKVLQNPHYMGICSDAGESKFLPMNENSVFHCASISKTFTSTAIMQLVEAGILNLYDRLVNLVPELLEAREKRESHTGDIEYRNDKSLAEDKVCQNSKSCIYDWRFSEIRLWNLLSHTSGLADVDDYHWERPSREENALANYVLTSPEVLNQPMFWAPQISPEFYGVVTDENGDPANLFRYSNIAYEILGYIVEKFSARIDEKENAGGLSYEDFIDKYMLKPLDMEDSTMKTFERCDFNDPIERNKCGMADPYMKAPDRSIVPVKFYPYTRYHAPSSTLTSTIGDLLKWGRAHLLGFAGEESEGGCESINEGENRCQSFNKNEKSCESIHDYEKGRGCVDDSERAETGKCEAKVLQKETYDSIWRDYATVPNNGEKMGLGWFMRKQKIEKSNGEKREYTLYGHEGTDDGFRASFWICPELDLVIAVLSNLSNAPVKRIAKKLFECLASINEV